MIRVDTFPEAPVTESLQFGNEVCGFIRNHFHLGNFYRLKIPFRNIYIVTSPELLQEILIEKEKNYLKSRIYWGELRLMVGKALGTTEGDEWEWLKRLQSRHFTHQVVEQMLPAVCANNHDFYSSWEQEQKPIDLIKHFSRMNIVYILGQLFGVQVKSEAATIAEFIADGEEIIAWRSKYPWRKHLVKYTAKQKRQDNYLLFFEDLLNRIIEEGKSNPKQNLWGSLWSNSIPARYGPLTFQELRNELIIHLGASTETAAVAMGWTIYLLMTHPEVMQRVQQELADVCGTQPVRAEDASRLVYLERVLKESLRIYPPSHSLIRDAQGPDEIMGRRIYKDDVFFVSIYGMHHHPQLWPNPEEFNPDRFINEDNIPKYAYIPFGAGRHNCVGRFLAMPMMLLSLAAFIKRFNISLHTSAQIHPVSLSSLKPSEPIMVSLSPH